MKHKESELQSACVTWFRYRYPREVLFAIPNGGQRNAITGAMLKREGVMAGVADLFLMKGYCGNEASHGLFLEAKTGKNKQQETQELFQQSAIAKGYSYEVFYSIEEFQKIISNYLKY